MLVEHKRYIGWISLPRCTQFTAMSFYFTFHLTFMIHNELAAQSMLWAAPQLNEWAWTIKHNENMGGIDNCVN